MFVDSLPVTVLVQHLALLVGGNSTPAETSHGRNAFSWLDEQMSLLGDSPSRHLVLYSILACFVMSWYSSVDTVLQLVLDDWTLV